MMHNSTSGVMHSTVDCTKSTSDILTKLPKNDSTANYLALGVSSTLLLSPYFCSFLTGLPRHQLQ